MQVKPSQARSMIMKFLQAKLTVMMTGSPGIGKSAIVQGVAKDFNLKVLDLRLAQCDPTDLLGMPTITNGRAAYAPFNTFPIEGDEIPTGYSGWLIFLDEFNSASTAVQAAAYKLVLDRMVGGHNLHKNVAIVCAGNLASDNAIVEEMSTALQSRLVHMQLALDPGEWVDWASANKIDYRITSFINFKPTSLYTFRPDHSDDTYSCPRTWEFANRIMAVTDEGSTERLTMLAGALSEGVAREFTTFCKIHQDLPTIVSITNAPEHITVPVEPSILFALTGSIAHNATVDNIGVLLKFVSRLPAEFQVVCMREAHKRTPEILKVPEMQTWTLTNARALF